LPFVWGNPRGGFQRIAAQRSGVGIGPLADQGPERDAGHDYRPAHRRSLRTPRRADLQGLDDQDAAQATRIASSRHMRRRGPPVGTTVLHFPTAMSRCLFGGYLGNASGSKNHRSLDRWLAGPFDAWRLDDTSTPWLARDIASVTALPSTTFAWGTAP
jgi:hypothetical protein